MMLKSTKSVLWPYIVYIVLIICVIISISILASVPPVDRDGLTHHLFIPKLYLQHGAIYEIPHISFSYYPMNLDLLYLIPLYFNNDIFPKFIHFAFALLTALLIYRYLLPRTNKGYALLGSLFFLSIPVIVRLSSTVYVDLGVIFFLFISLLSIFKWIELNFKTKYLVYGAIFCGLALGTKYNGLIGLFLLGLFIAFVYARYHRNDKMHAPKSIGWSALYVMVALLVFSPWMIRNAAWTGNPVYPLYKSIFNQEVIESKTTPDTGFQARSRMSHIQIRREIYGESWGQILLIPLRVFFQGKDDDPQYFDGRTSPFLFLLPIFAFFGIRSDSQQEKTEKVMMFAFSVLFLFFACAQTSIRIRYFAPIIPPLVILSMFGLYNLQTKILYPNKNISNLTNNFIVFIIIVVMLSLNAFYIVNRFKIDQPIVYLTGKVTRDEYIQVFRPDYATFQYANQNLTQNDKILGLYIGNRGYYSDIPIDFSITMLQKLAAEAQLSRDVAENLKKRGFTHVVVNLSLFNYWVQKYSFYEKQILKDFFESHTIKEFTKDGYGLWRINN